MGVQLTADDTKNSILTAMPKDPIPYPVSMMVKHIQAKHLQLTVKKITFI